MNRKDLTIGLFGFGCVGTGLYEVLSKTPSFKTTIKRICVRDPQKKRTLHPSYFTFDKNDILEDPGINVVVELIDDPEAAFHIVKAALNAGKAVVTANKKMIAEHFEELLFLQRSNKVSLLYEGACCAGIPIIRNLEEYYDTDLLESIDGIVNGTTNYILSKTATENIGYDEALKNARDLGFVESNPSLDLSGLDAKYKLQILLVHAFGLMVKPGELFNYGIERISDMELNYAREKGYRIKLVAHAHKTNDGKIVAMVTPKFVEKEDRLFTVDNVFNGIEIKSCFSDVHFFAGRGAGALPTASAVLSDLSALSYDYKYEYKKIGKKEKLETDGQIALKVFLRHSMEHASYIRSYFETVEENYRNAEMAFTTGTLSLENLKEILSELPETSFILFNIVTLKKALAGKLSLKAGYNTSNAD